jgi:hypothetical protein
LYIYRTFAINIVLLYTLSKRKKIKNLLVNLWKLSSTVRGYFSRLKGHNVTKLDKKKLVLFWRMMMAKCCLKSGKERRLRGGSWLCVCAQGTEAAKKSGAGGVELASPAGCAAAGPNDIVACTNCGGGSDPCTHPANNGCHGSISEVLGWNPTTRTLSLSFYMSLPHIHVHDVDESLLIISLFSLQPALLISLQTFQTLNYTLRVTHEPSLWGWKAANGQKGVR